MIGTADSRWPSTSLYAKLSYDPSKFTYIGIAKFPLLLAVNVNSPYSRWPT